MSLFFVAAWSFTNGIVNEHLVYLIATATLGVFGAGRYYGLDAVVEKLAIVQRYPALHYALG
jgi:thiosulfate dehydrogenase [quinone] large subunit